MSSLNAIPAGTQPPAEPSLAANEQLSIASNSSEHPASIPSPSRTLSTTAEITQDQNTPAQPGDSTESPDPQRLLARIRELEAQVHHLVMHLASVTAVVRAEDGRITSSFRGTAGESPGIHVFRNLHRGDAVEIVFFHRDMTQPEPEFTMNDVRSEANGNSDNSSQIIVIEQDEELASGEPRYPT